MKESPKKNFSLIFFFAECVLLFVAMFSLMDYFLEDNSESNLKSEIGVFDSVNIGSSTNLYLKNKNYDLLITSSSLFKSKLRKLEKGDTLKYFYRDNKTLDDHINYLFNHVSIIALESSDYGKIVWYEEPSLFIEIIIIIIVFVFALLFLFIIYGWILSFMVYWNYEKYNHLTSHFLLNYKWLTAVEFQEMDRKMLE